MDSHLASDDFGAHAADQAVLGAGVVEEGLGAVEVELRDVVGGLQVGLDLAHFLEELQAELTEQASVDLQIKNHVLLFEFWDSLGTV